MIGRYLSLTGTNLMESLSDKPNPFDGSRIALSHVVAESPFGADGRGAARSR